MPQTKDYQRNYYWRYRERMNAKSLQCYYERKERNNRDPKKEFKNIVNLFKHSKESGDCDNSER